MKKLLSIFALFMIIIPSITSAKISHSAMQKEMIIAKYEVTQMYGIKVNNRLDELFAQKIESDDLEIFSELQGKLNTYFSNIPRDKNLTKKEKLYKYLYIRSTYELSFRNK